ncbi:MAG: polysaccharide deacetylase family protein [Rhodopseudomonas sp.]|nr:polysaccharide deacetylase family protein [Rhodopseudomonas sp.]
MSGTSRRSLLRFGCLAAMASAGLAGPAYAQNPTPDRMQAPTNGLIMLIEFEKIDGIRHWERELDQRGISALIQASPEIMAKYPDDFARLAAKGYMVAGNHSEKPFWDMPYDQQLALMHEAKATVERITHKPMRVFGSRYFAYDENTLRAADALGIDYVLGRGTAGALATIYAPREYKAKVISVSNVPFAEMGTGSLCDYSLWARGSTGKDFGVVAEKVLASGLSDLILVSHAYIGGMYKEWWQVYEAALADKRVTWRPFDAWVRSVKVTPQPFAQIPINREVKYDKPQPAVPLPKLELLPEFMSRGK